MPPHRKFKAPSRGQKSTRQLDPAHGGESPIKSGDNFQTKDGVLEVQTTHRYFLRSRAGRDDIIERESDSLALVPKTDEAQTGKEIFPFLTLPPEIRNKIYRDDAFRECDDTVLAPSEHKRMMMRPLWQPPITRVNRQIRNESLSIIYGEEQFIYHLPGPDLDEITHADFLDAFQQFYAVLDRFTPKSRTGRAQQSPGIYRVRSDDSSGNKSASAGILEPRGLRSPSTLRFLTILEITVGFPAIDEQSTLYRRKTFYWRLFWPQAVGFRMCSVVGAPHYSNDRPHCQRRLSTKRLDWENPATVDEEYSRCIGKLDYGFHVLAMRDRYHLYKSSADLPPSGLPIDVDVMCSVAKHCPELTDSVWAIVE